METTFKFKVIFDEHERDWGVKQDSVEEYATYEEAVAAINAQNALNNLPVAPDVYMTARPGNFTIQK